MRRGPCKIKGRPVMKAPAPVKRIFAKSAAVLVVDVQAEFCDPKGRFGNYETEHVARNIQKLMPSFRKAGLSAYAIYFSRAARANTQDAGFYHFKPQEGDTIIPKKKTSAFTNRKLKKHLQKNGKETVFVLGVNYNVCVCETAFAAKKRGFDVYVVDDLSANGNTYSYPDRLRLEKKMQEYGINIIDSARLLKSLKPGK